MVAKRIPCINQETERSGPCQLVSPLSSWCVATFVQFLSDLYEIGHVSLPVLDQGEGPDFASQRAQELISSRDQTLRLSAAGSLPELAMPVALMGARCVYLGCQLFVDRTRPVTALDGCVHEIGKLSPTPSTVYSLDLALAFLPDLHAHARQLVEDDELMRLLDQLARLWPFSAVGIPVNESPWDRIALWWDDVGLRISYVDRLLARDEGACLRHVPVAEAVKDALGMRVEELAGDSVRTILAT
jgi:hypothetical protein